MWSFAFASVLIATVVTREENGPAVGADFPNVAETLV
jgi:hypothetical protein